MTTAVAVAAIAAPRGAPSSSTGTRIALEDVPLSATAPQSDAFSSWSQVGTADGPARFLASDLADDGDFSLLVTRPASSGSAGTPGLGQAVQVGGGAQLRLGLRARSDGGVDDAVEVRMIAAGAPPAVLALPSGPFDWTAFALDLTVPQAATRIDLQIVSVGPTDGLWIDGLRLSGATSAAEPLNGGFEENSADLDLTDPSLVLRRGSAALHLSSRRAETGAVRWQVRSVGDPDVVLSGTAELQSGRAEVGLAALPAGYYELAVHTEIGVRDVDRLTDFLITDPMPATVPGAASRLGVGIHLNAGGTPTTDQQLSDLAALGIRYVRTDVDWASAETTPGTYVFPPQLDEMVATAVALGIRPLLIPDYANPLYDGGATPSSTQGIAAYARFAAAVAQRYPAADIDVYNEFNGRFNTGACGRTPQCYLQLLSATSAAVRGAGTSAAISGPSISGGAVDDSWLQSFIRDGGLADVDAVSLHPYVQPAAPEVMEAALDRLDVSMGASPRPIWFTEFGSSTQIGGRSADQQAADLVRATAIGAPRGVTRVYWYDAVDDSAMQGDPESNFGLFGRPTSFAPSALVPKPSAAAEATLAREIAGTTGASVVPGYPDDIRVIEFAGGAGAVLVAWSLDGEHRARMTGGEVTTVTGRHLGSGGSTLTLSGDPVYLTGGAELRLTD